MTTYGGSAWGPLPPYPAGKITLAGGIAPVLPITDEEPFLLMPARRVVRVLGIRVMVGAGGVK